MNFTKEAEQVEFSFPLLAQETEEVLDGFHARAQTDYLSWKRDLLEWLYYEGKDSDRLRGYSEYTL